MEFIMSQQTKNMLKSWFNVFIAATLASFSALLIDGGTLALDTKALEAVLISGLIAVLPVIKNYFDKQDPRYGKVDAAE
jgi:hypothetical protein